MRPGAGRFLPRAESSGATQKKRRGFLRGAQVDLESDQRVVELVDVPVVAVPVDTVDSEVVFVVDAVSVDVVVAVMATEVVTPVKSPDRPVASIQVPETVRLVKTPPATVPCSVPMSVTFTPAALVPVHSQEAMIVSPSAGSVLSVFSLPEVDRIWLM